MSKSAAGARGSGEGFLQGLVQSHLYKRTQGRITRQVTCAVVWLTTALAAWRLWARLTLSELPEAAVYAIPGLLLLVGLWLGYRLVNYPRFADFLIAVEAEMNKVSWPAKLELIRSSIVVMFVIFALAFVLFTYDALWKFVFEALGVLAS